VLRSFSHRSDPVAPESCLAQFEAVQAEGIDLFCQLHDPYFLVPLPAAPAQSVDLGSSQGLRRRTPDADSSFVNDRRA